MLRNLIFKSHKLLYVRHPKAARCFWLYHMDIEYQHSDIEKYEGGAGIDYG